MSEPRFADLHSSPAFERGWNGLQSFIEIFVIIVVLAGLAGLLGTGPLSSQKVQFDTLPLTMSYERIGRRSVQTELQIKSTSPLPGEVVEIEIPHQLTDKIDIVSTSPRSTRMRAEPDGIVYVFELGAARLGTITFSIKPQKAGLINSVVRSGTAQAAFGELVLP